MNWIFDETFVVLVLDEHCDDEVLSVDYVAKKKIVPFVVVVDFADFVKGDGVKWCFEALLFAAAADFEDYDYGRLDLCWCY